MTEFSSRHPTSPDVRAPFLPTGCHPSFDKFQLWFKERLSPRKLKRIPPCDLYPDLPPPHDCWPYRQGIQIKHPYDPQVMLPFLANLSSPDVLLNAAEPFIDWIFHNEVDLQNAEKFFSAHVVQRWHGEPGRPSGGAVHYLTERGAPNSPAFYSDKPSRITGEVFCLHYEWRLNGSQALKRAGVRLHDLPTFDHRTFWTKRLLLGSIDCRLLGRIVCNRNNGTPRRRSLYWHFGHVVHDEHLRTGNVLFAALGGDPSMQKLLDAYGAKFNLMRKMDRFDVTHLLPP